MSVVRVVTSGVYQNQLMQNVIHFEDTDSFLTLAQVVEEIQAYWIAFQLAYQQSAFRWIDIAAKFEGDQTAPYHKPVNIKGSYINDPSCLPFICIKLKIHTPVAGRSGRGRIYLMGMNASFNWLDGYLGPEGTLNTGVICGQIAARYVGLNSAGPLTLGILGKRKPPSAFIVADGIAPASTAGVLRRRNTGVGV